jgi:alpha-beta hydrolase superfamily lysophospholipase
MAESTPTSREDLEPTLRGSLAGSDGVALAFARWELPAPRGRVVIAHGYGEHGERYGHTARWLNRLGWAVSTLDHRGFGRSGGIRGDARGIRAPVADLVLFLRQERRHDAGRDPGAGPGPQVLLGHSFGGLLALLALWWHPDAMEGLIVSSPALRLRPLPAHLRLLQLVARRVMPHRPLEVPGDKAQVCSDPDLVRRYREDPHCHRYISAGFVAAMAEGARELMAAGAELDRPILLLEAGRDTVVDPDGAEALWAALRPGLLERHRLDGFFHEIFHDRGRAQAEDLTARWLDRHFPAGGAPPVPDAATSLNPQGTP